jgi:16S rRNA (guanine1207-N2)-methyltransferase
VEISPDDKVLDLGCGYGLVGVYAAKLARPEAVHLLDIDPQATRAAERNLAINEVSGATVSLSDGFRDFGETGFSKILCNAPHHVDFAVPKPFIEKGFNRLAIGGTLWMVTKREAWYRQKLSAIFGGCRVHAEGGYSVFEATRRTPAYTRR